MKMINKNFKNFYETILPDIIESIKIEFKDHISESDIDLYIRRALSVFEGYELYNFYIKFFNGIIPLKNKLTSRFSSFIVSIALINPLHLFLIY